jgi:hypothetical protein
MYISVRVRVSLESTHLSRYGIQDVQKIYTHPSAAIR